MTNKHIAKELDKLDNLKENGNLNGNLAEYLDVFTEIRKSFFHSCSIDNEYSARLKNRIIKHNDYYMVEIEKRTALKIQDKTITNYSELLYEIDNIYLYNRLADKSMFFKPFKFKLKGKFVLIGSGAFPDTLLYLGFNNLFRQLIGLEINYELLKIGSSLTNKILKNKKVEFIHTDANRFIYENTDFIFIAGFVRNKEQILNQIFNTTRLSVTVLVDLNNLFYEPIDFDTIASSKLNYRKHIINTSYGVQKLLEITKRSNYLD